MKEWINRDEYPFASKHCMIGNHRLHYIDEGDGDTLLFVHGTPSWSFDFRNVIKALRAHYRCIAIDHIGFGLSDKPASYDYSTLNHSHTLEAFVKELALKEITLAVHDFGGPIGLSFAIRNPRLIKKLVIMNSWLWSSEAEPAYQKFRKVLKSPLLPILYKYFNFSARFILPDSFGKKKPSKDILRHYTMPFNKPGERIGTIAFAASLLNDQQWFESLWMQRSVIAGKPALFIWGMRDRFITRKYLEKFVSGFPDSTAVTLEDCGHFPQEEAPLVVADRIHSFLSQVSGRENVVSLGSDV